MKVLLAKLRACILLAKVKKVRHILVAPAKLDGGMSLPSVVTAESVLRGLLDRTAGHSSKTHIVGG